MELLHVLSNCDWKGLAFSCQLVLTILGYKGEEGSHLILAMGHPRVALSDS